MPEAKKPFVGAEDRSEGEINPDQLVSELRVRDLASIMGIGGRKVIEKIKADNEKPFHWEKPVHWEKFKIEKLEKFEKLEHKEPIFEPIKRTPEFPIGPGEEFGPDPVIQETLAGLVNQVQSLTAQVEALKKQR